MSKVTVENINKTTVKDIDKNIDQKNLALGIPQSFLTFLSKAVILRVIPMGSSPRYTNIIELYLNIKNINITVSKN